MTLLASPHAPAAGADLRRAIDGACQWLLARQHADGHWRGELEGDTILESEYLLLLAWLGEEHSPLARKCGNYLLQQQLPGGGWAMFPGGELDVSGSVKAYFALKLLGHPPDEPPLARARAAILAAGGADAVNSFTRYYLALLGQLDYEHCPAVPPEFILLPRWLPANIYRISAWSRTMFVPLALVWAHRPRRELPPERGVAELFLRPPAEWPRLECPGLPPERGWWRWGPLFYAADRAVKWCERRRLTPLRRRALAAARDWMLRRFERSDGLGAIFPPIVWSLVALKCLGYSDDSPEVRYQREQLAALTIEEETTARLQPCQSPVWDTALSLRGLAAAGLRIGEPAVARGVEWLLGKEVRSRGDWAENAPAEPGGWFFEYENAFYPDVDDTAMALLALRETAGAEQSDVYAGRAADAAGARTLAEQFGRIAAACDRGERWMLALQNRDGGWGAFDKDNDAEWLCRVPFADHNAMIDPSTPDLAARAIEALAAGWRRRGTPAVDRAIAYLRRAQEPDGSWYGRWGVNYLYGTWQALVGLAAAGVPADDPAIARGADWLLQAQFPSGGWGESAETYEHPERKGQGPATPSQTAWALLGLVAAGRGDDPAIARGVQFLLDRQRADGGWDEPQFTGAGFPRVFYLRYHYYPIYFPLLALSTCARVL